MIIRKLIKLCKFLINVALKGEREMTGYFEHDQYNIGQRDHGFIFVNSNFHK